MEVVAGAASRSLRNATGLPVGQLSTARARGAPAAAATARWALVNTANRPVAKVLHLDAALGGACRRPKTVARGNRARRRLLVELAEREALGFPLGITLGVGSQRAGGRVVGDELRRPQQLVVALAGWRRRSPSWMLSGHGPLPIGRRSARAAAPARKVDDRPSRRRRGDRPVADREGSSASRSAFPSPGDPRDAAR